MNFELKKNTYKNFKKGRLENDFDTFQELLSLPKFSFLFFHLHANCTHLHSLPAVLRSLHSIQEDIL